MSLFSQHMLSTNNECTWVESENVQKYKSQTTPSCTNRSLCKNHVSACVHQMEEIQNDQTTEISEFPPPPKTVTVVCTVSLSNCRCLQNGYLCTFLSTESELRSHLIHHSMGHFFSGMVNEFQVWKCAASSMGEKIEGPMMSVRAIWLGT